MHDITHDSIKITDNGRVALLGYHSYAILEGIKCFIQPVFLIIGYALIVIESHFIGIILTCLPTKRNDTITIFCLPGIADELQAGCRIVGSDAQGLIQHWGNAVVRHLLQIHIGRTEKGQISIALGQREHLMKQVQHTGRISSLLLTLANDLTHQCHTILR